MKRKPTFTGSIVPAVILLVQLIDSGKLPVSLPELTETARAVPGVRIYKDLELEKKLD